MEPLLWIRALEPLNSRDPARQKVYGASYPSMNYDPANLSIELWKLEEGMSSSSSAPITTNIPQRRDRLPWSRWHWLVVTALGVTWLLDGLEVFIVAALGPVLTRTTTLHHTESEVGLPASAYLAGSVLGPTSYL